VPPVVTNSSCDPAGRIAGRRPRRADLGRMSSPGRAALSSRLTCGQERLLQQVCFGSRDAGYRNAGFRAAAQAGSPAGVVAWGVPVVALVWSPGAAARWDGRIEVRIASRALVAALNALVQAPACSPAAVERWDGRIVAWVSSPVAVHAPVGEPCARAADAPLVAEQPDAPAEGVVYGSAGVDPGLPPVLALADSAWAGWVSLAWRAVKQAWRDAPAGLAVPGLPESQAVPVVAARLPVPGESHHAHQGL
jgi:hypothetical protein